jgi:hypothetical protein
MKDGGSDACSRGTRAEKYSDCCERPPEAHEGRLRLQVSHTLPIKLSFSMWPTTNDLLETSAFCAKDQTKRSR